MAIKAEDVREPIRLVFEKDVRIVGSSVEKTLPSDFRFQAAFNQTDNSITCSFLLLNSGDEAYFSVYTYNSLPQIPVVSGRIVDVKRIEELDESQKAQTNPFPFANSLGVRRILYWTLTVLNSVLALLAVYLGAWAARVFLAYRAWPKKIEEAGAAAKEAIKNAEGQPLDFNTALAMEAKKRGISTNFSFAYYSDWKELLGGTLVFLVLFLVFASTAVFMFFSPRGY